MAYHFFAPSPLSLLLSKNLSSAFGKGYLLKRFIWERSKLIESDTRRKWLAPKMINIWSDNFPIILGLFTCELFPLFKIPTSIFFKTMWSLRKQSGYRSQSNLRNAKDYYQKSSTKHGIFFVLIFTMEIGEDSY